LVDRRSLIAFRCRARRSPAAPRPALLTITGSEAAHPFRSAHRRKQPHSNRQARDGCVHQPIVRPRRRFQGRKGVVQLFLMAATDRDACAARAEQQRQGTAIPVVPPVMMTDLPGPQYLSFESLGRPRMLRAFGLCIRIVAVSVDVKPSHRIDPNPRHSSIGPRAYPHKTQALRPCRVLHSISPRGGGCRKRPDRRVLKTVRDDSWHAVVIAGEVRPGYAAARLTLGRIERPRRAERRAVRI